MTTQTKNAIMWILLILGLVCYAGLKVSISTPLWYGFAVVAVTDIVLYCYLRFVKNW